MADNNYKKSILHQLISSATNGAGSKSLHEVINSIKSALGAYKNFAKEWDNIEGVVSGATAGAPKAPGGGQANMLKGLINPASAPPQGQMPPPMPNLQPGQGPGSGAMPIPPQEVQPMPQGQLRG